MNLIIKHLMSNLKGRHSAGFRSLLLLFFIIITLGSEVAYTQTGKPSRQAAEKAWASGDYETAYDNYNGLLLMYTRDPLYAYYTGACLVNLKRDIPRSVTLLRSASHSAQNVKNIPDEIWFYYGRSLQLSGNFSEATDAYEKYVKTAGKKKAQELGVQRYIEECSMHTGSVEESSGKPDTDNNITLGKAHLFSNGGRGDDNSRRMVSLQRYQFMSDSLMRIAKGIRDQLDSSPGEVRGLMRSRIVELETQAGRYDISADSIRMILSNDGIATIADAGANAPYNVEKSEHPVGGEIVVAEKEPVEEPTEKVIVSQEYDRQLTRAMKLQFTSDSLAREADGLRRKAETVTSAEKETLRKRAVALDDEAIRCRKEADEILLRLEPDMAVGLIPVDEGVNNTRKQVASDTVRTTVVKETEVVEAKEEPAHDDTNVKNENKKVFTCFEVRQTPAYSETNPVPSGAADYNGLVYHIQMAAFRNPVAPSYFRNLYPVFGVLNSTNGVTYYYTGVFRTKEDALKALPSVRTNGFADAFVVAFINKSQVSMEKAAQEETKWKQVPLYEEKTIVQSRQQEQQQPVPSGTLIFRAEVLRSAKPVKPDVMDKIELLAENRQLDILRSNKGETIILIGKFITFESADDYVSLLIRNGYSEARVSAWVGANEIPVETARELLKQVTDE